MEMPLTQDRIALIDAADAERVLLWSWHAHKSGRRYYARGGPDGHTYLHHFILGKRIRREIDHINGNGLDNHRENLRFVTRTGNNLNRSNVHGVEKHGRGWRARLWAHGQRQELGTFATAEEARNAYLGARQTIMED